MASTAVPDVEAALTALELLARAPGAPALMTAAVADALRPVIGARAAAITIWDGERDILRALPGAFGATDRDRPASITGPASNPRSNSARVFATGESYVANHALGDPGLLQSYVEAFALERVLSVALAIGSSRIGVLQLVNKPEPFTAEDVATLERVAPRVAGAVELALWMERSRLREELEGVIAAAAVAIASGRSVSDSLLPAFSQLAALTDATMVGLIPHDGLPLTHGGEGLDPALERRFLGDAAALARRSTGRYPQAAGDPGWAALHAPVSFGSEHSATLSVLRQTGRPFSADEADAVGRLANTAALAWATERYQHQLAELARSRERERIADELHDRVTQILFAAQIGLDSMLEAPAGAPADRERIDDVRNLLAKGETAVREVIRRLETDPQPGLERRLRMEVEAVEDEFGVAVHVDLDAAGDLGAVARPVAECLVKVTREATVNAAKHAGPCRIGVTVRAAGGRVELEVLDDGIGLLRGDTGGHGVPALRRAVRDAGGTLRISRTGAVGTRVVATFD